MKKTILSLLLAIFTIFNLSSQIYIGIGGGTTFLFGDADKIKSGYYLRPNLEYHFLPNFYLRTEYNYGIIQGSRKIKSPTLFKDNFNFRSEIQDVNLQVFLSFNKIPFEKTSIYIFGGFGIISYQTKSTFIDRRLFRTQSDQVFSDYYLDHYFGRSYRNQNLNKSVEEHYSESSLIIPFGVGFKSKISRQVTIGFEYRQTHTRSDNIDGYVNPSYLFVKFDNYGMTNINLSYKIIKSKRKTRYRRIRMW